MAKPQLILVVDDDPHIIEVVRFALGKGGFRTAEAGDGGEALKAFAELSPDLIILDVMMQEMDGTEVCRRIRAGSQVPIIFLSSKDEEIDRIIGLELGGDDYVTKPFSPRELVARVTAVLRRSSAVAQATAATVAGECRTIGFGRLTLDLDRFQVRWEGREIVLTVTEFGLLKTLLGFPGKVFTRDELIAGAYDHDNHITDRTIDSHVRRIRRKIGDAGGDPIETIHGLGYRLGPC